MSEIKSFKLTKTSVNDVLFILRPASNPNMQMVVTLTAKNPSKILPLDWALGVFQDPGIFALYEKGLISFTDNAAAVKAAYENGVYFSDELEFEPAELNQTDLILDVIKTGNRKSILEAIEKHGRDTVCAIASANVGQLSTNVVSMLESILKVQLTIDDETSSDVE